MPEGLPDEPGAQPAPQLEELFGTQADFVWRVLRRLGVAEAELDDALQEVFLVAAQKIEGYVERGGVRAWLFTIARQIAMHFRRSESRRLRRRDALSAVPPPPHADPEQTLQLRQAAETIERALSQLEERQAMAVYLADIEGLTAPEIANALGVNLNTVYGRIRLGRQRFRALLRNPLEGSGGAP